MDKKKNKGGVLSVRCSISQQRWSALVLAHWWRFVVGHAVIGMQEPSLPACTEALLENLSNHTPHSTQHTKTPKPI